MDYSHLKGSIMEQLYNTTDIQSLLSVLASGLQQAVELNNKHVHSLQAYDRWQEENMEWECCHGTIHVGNEPCNCQAEIYDHMYSHTEEE